MSNVCTQAWLKTGLRGFNGKYPRPILLILEIVETFLNIDFFADKLSLSHYSRTKKIAWFTKLGFIKQFELLNR